MTMNDKRIAAQADMEAAARYRALAERTVNGYFKREYLKRAAQAESIGQKKLAECALEDAGMKEYEVRYRVLTAGNQFHRVHGYTEDDARDAVRKKHPEAFDIYIQHVPMTTGKDTN